MEFLKCPAMSCLVSCGWSMLNLEGWLASCSVPNNDKENAQNSHQNTFFAQCKRQCKRSIAHVLGRPVLCICGSGCHCSTWSRSIWHAQWVIKHRAEYRTAGVRMDSNTVQSNVAWVPMCHVNERVKWGAVGTPLERDQSHAVIQRFFPTQAPSNRQS